MRHLPSSESACRPRISVLVAGLLLLLSMEVNAAFLTRRLHIVINKPSFSTPRLATSNHDVLTKQRRTTPFTIPSITDVIVLSQDPLVYLIPDLLDAKECQSYIARVQAFQADASRPMTLSNPPEVSLEISKLWPLPFLSLLAGLPPWLRLHEAQKPAATLDQVLSAVLPPIGLALVATFVLAFAIALPLVRRISSTSSRTSTAVALNLEEDVEFCRDFVDRVAQTTSHPWYSWEAPVVTRYEPGAVFSRHGDASPTLGTEWADQGGQRVITCICYLNTVPRGGETSFDQLGIHVKPEQGQALVFFPADVTTLRADPKTTHESLPPQQEKWIVQMFGRIGPRVPPPLGLPDSFGSRRH